MNEVMTTEAIVEAEWIVNGYWTKARFQYRTTNKKIEGGHGGWSDIDVLAYHPKSGHLVISESKAQGGARDLFAFTGKNDQTFEQYIEKTESNYLDVLDKIANICLDSGVKELCQSVKKITVQLVFNIVLDESKKPQVQAELRKMVAAKLKPFPEFEDVELELQIDTHLDVIARIINQTRQAIEQGYGKRYGHPILDFARELNRYLNPTLRDAGREGDLQESMKKQAIRSFSKALGSCIFDQPK